MSEGPQSGEPDDQRALSPESRGPIERAAARHEAGLTDRPQTLGRLRIDELIGEGAMGIVYRAYDPELDRRVAVKILKRADSGNAKRLRREAMALARLSHPNVVAVHDIDTVDGRVFIAMEYVQGQTLHDWRLQRQRSWRTCVAVYLGAGEGLAAAHSAGLVHRDFKPKNCLLDSDGRPRVVDFGLAGGETFRHGSSSAAEPGPLCDSPTHESLTAPGGFVGTPAYASPEQLDNVNATAKSDQFSFCVTLWEALYGERPLAGRPGAPVDGADDKRRPSGDSDVPRWIRNVLERGLHRDPSRRWTSMEDLLRALREDPTPKRRRRVTALVAVVALGAAVVLLWYVQLLAEERTLAGCEQEGRLIAEVWDETTRQRIRDVFLSTELPFAPAMDGLVADELSGFVARWDKTRSDNCRAELVEQRIDTAEAETVRTCLDHRRMMLIATVDALSEATALEVEQAGGLVAALPSIEQCIDSRTRPVYFSLPQNAAERAQAREILKLVTKVRAKEELLAFESAHALAEEAVELAQILRWEPLLLTTTNRLGWIQHKVKRSDVAEASLEAGFLAALRAGNKEEAIYAATSLISVVGADRARLKDAIRWEELALAVLESSGGPTDDVRRADIQHEAARAYVGGAEYLKAIELAQSAIRTYEPVLGVGHPALAPAYNTLGGAYRGSGKYEDSVDAHNRARTLIADSYGRAHPRVAGVLHSLGNVSAEMGDFDAARDYYERAIILYEALGVGALGQLGGALVGLADFYKRQGDYPLSRKTIAKATDLFRRNYGESDYRVGVAFSLLGNIALAEGATEEALEHHSKVVEIFRESLGAEHPHYGGAMGNKGQTLQKLGRHEEALAASAVAMQVVEQSLGADHPDMALWLQNSGISKRALGDLRGGLALHRQALALNEKHHGTQSTRLVDPLLSIGVVHLDRGDTDQALASFQRARKIYLASPETEPTILGGILFGVAKATTDDPALARETAMSARAQYSRVGPGQQHRVDEIDAWLERQARQAQP